ncbi:MAG TPA: phosphotransferase [Vicinamibacteria bacterium]|nr:phosphotransferase [Vicinamibacteria bacterium]
MSMNASPMGRALERLESGSREKIRSGSIRRVEVGRKGWLDLTADVPGGQRWFRWDSRQSRELLPEHDRSLPLARRLPGDARVLSYRPDRRIVIEHDQEGHRVVEKGYRKGRSRLAADRYSCMEETRGSGFVVPRLIRHRRETESLVFEHIRGESLTSPTACPDVFARLGAALRKLQDHGAVERLEPFGPEEEIAVLDRWAAKVHEASGGLPEEWSQLRADLERKRPDPTSCRVGMTHRDLHDRQLLITRSGLAILDCDLLCRADVALDPANLIAHLHLRALQKDFDGRAAEGASEAFLAGLGRSGEPGFRERLGFYQTSSYLRLALVYSLRPRWLDRVPALLRLARCCLVSSRNR